MKRIQNKEHKLGICKIDKIFFSCFDNNRYVLDEKIRALAFLYKNSVTSCKEIEKDCDN